MRLCLGWPVPGVASAWEHEAVPGVASAWEHEAVPGVASAWEHEAVPGVASAWEHEAVLFQFPLTNNFGLRGVSFQRATTHGTSYE